MRPLVILWAFAPAFLLVSQSPSAAAAEKKGLEQYLEENAVFQDFLGEDMLAAFQRLHAAVDPAKPETERPLKEELQRAREAHRVFLRWRGKPAEVKAERDRDAKAFDVKWAQLGRYVDKAKLDNLRADAGLDGGGDWYERLQKYLACKANAAACTP